MPESPLTQRGQFASDQAGKYLQQLCKHFAHKVTVSFDANSGTAALPQGPARLSASATGLVVDITAPHAEGLAQARGIIDSHLARFAFREGFQTMEWAPPPLE